jgi:hypothetical protein
MKPMTDWIDFAVYATFLVAIFFVQPAMQRRLIVPLLFDRNPEWAAAHPEIVRHIAGIRWRLWVCYAMGAISLGVVLTYQLGLWSAPPSRAGTVPPKWMILWLLSMAAMTTALIVTGAIGLQGWIALKRLVPIAPRRHATLERRSLDDYVPRGVQLAGYAIVIVNLIAWTAAGIAGAHSSPIFWERVTIMYALSALFFFFTHVMVARRANVMDRLIGPAYRRWEVRWVFSTQFVTPLVGAVRLYEEVTGTELLDLSRALQLLLAGYITWFLIRSAMLIGASDTPSPGQSRMPATAHS